MTERTRHANASRQRHGGAVLKSAVDPVERRGVSLSCRGRWVALNLIGVTIVVAAGCETRGPLELAEPASPAEPRARGAHESVDGLSSRAALSQLTDFEHGLATDDGLPSSSGLMTTAEGRKSVQYLVRCALAAGDSLEKQDQNGNAFSFAGQLGLAPQFKDGACDQSCRELLTACILAHVNVASTAEIPLWLTAAVPAIGWDLDPAYPVEEASYFGDLWATAATGYACAGPDLSTNVVPGRFGIGPGDGPSYSDVTLAKEIRSANEVAGGACVACTRNGASGLGACSLSGTTYANPITVWRSRAYFGREATLAGGAVLLTCNTCVPPRIGYLTPGASATFDGVASPRAGAASLLVYYTNGDSPGSARKLDISVNGGASISATFHSRGDWNALARLAVPTTGLVASDSNTITFSATADGSGPDIAWIEVVPSS